MRSIRRRPSVGSATATVKWSRSWFAIVLLLLGFAVGVAVRQLIFVVDFNPGPQFEVEPTHVRVQSAEQVATTREALIRYVFGSSGLPAESPVDHGDGTYTVLMPDGFQSLVRMVRPTDPNGRLVLYHAGHAAYGEVDRTVVDELVSRGYAVLVFDMPLIGVNATPLVVELPNGPVTIWRHDQMAYLSPATTGSPIRYFLEPVVVMLNALSPQYGDITMIGLSGGGWTTTLAAAIDDRIDRSYPAAGTLPLAVQFAREDAWGDWEQNEPSLYAIADYVDLYVLGAHERRQLQILNEFDPCCFSGDYRSIYELQVQAAIKASGGGSFDVLLDGENRQHSISSVALEAIISDIEAVPAN